MTLVAVITGASSGIGEAVARRLAQEPDTRLVLVARREDRLRALADSLGGATVVAADLVRPESRARVREAVEREHGELHLLVNNAGASWRGTFADSGWDNLERHMQLNFEAPVRLTEEVLPLLRATAARTGGGGDRVKAPVSIVNVASTAARVARPAAGAYSASKMALAGWSDALCAEEREHGIHVGLVLPGFIETEGFPAAELTGRALTRWLVSKPEAAAEAVFEAGPGGKAERYVPRGYWVFAALRILAPGLIRRAVAGGGMTTATGADAADSAAASAIRPDV
jgi:short-subunit dehydrogenase